MDRLGITASFMGLWEAIAWVGTRDHSVVCDAASDAMRYRGDGTGVGAFAMTAFDAHSYDPQQAFNDIADKCAAGMLQATGHQGDGFKNIPANDWHGGNFLRAEGSDAFVLATNVPWGPTCWRGVRFPRADVERLFNELDRRLIEDEPAGETHPQSTVKGITDCTDWLRIEFARVENAAQTKAGFKEIALLKFAGRLSGRGFGEAWRGAINSCPERAKPGPKNVSS